MNIKRFENIWLLLLDIKLCSSGNILCADNLPNFGWVDQETEDFWEISIFDAKCSMKIADDSSIERLNKYFSNRREEGNNIYHILDDMPYIKRLCNLKAFL